MFHIVALPVIVAQPTSDVFRVDYESTTLWCSANGTGPIHYQWEKFESSNDSWIIPAHRVVNSTSPKLKFSMLSEEDEGIYHCVVTNDDGIVTSDNATITVFGMYITSYIGYIQLNDCTFRASLKCCLGPSSLRAPQGFYHSKAESYWCLCMCN